MDLSLRKPPNFHFILVFLLGLIILLKSVRSLQSLPLVCTRILYLTLPNAFLFIYFPLKPKPYVDVIGWVNGRGVGGVRKGSNLVYSLFKLVLGGGGGTACAPPLHPLLKPWIN